MASPEDRYKKLSIKVLPNGKRVYKSAIPKNVPVTDTDISFVANEADRMDVIANNAYGSPMDWWRLAAANKTVDGSIHFKPGSTVIIPKA